MRLSLCVCPLDVGALENIPEQRMLGLGRFLVPLCRLVSPYSITVTIITTRLCTVIVISNDDNDNSNSHVPSSLPLPL